MFYSVIIMITLAFCFSIYKKNYDSVIINPTIFAGVSMILIYKAFIENFSSNIEAQCSIESFMKAQNLFSFYFQSKNFQKNFCLVLFLGILSKFSSNPLSFEQEMLSNCLNINFFLNIIMPIFILLTIKFSISEWKFFIFGEDERY